MAANTDASNAPPAFAYRYNKRAKAKADDIDDALGVWRHWPTKKYLPAAQPYKALKLYMTDVFEPAKALARSASATRLIYNKDSHIETIPLRRCESYSLLAPSHVLESCERIVHPHQPFSPFQAYHPKCGEWASVYNTHKSLQRYYNDRNLAINASRSQLMTHLAEKEAKPEGPEKRDPDHPRRFWITKPADPPLWHYTFLYYQGKIRGLDHPPTSMYTNYDRLDDRRDYMKYLISPSLRSNTREWHQHNQPVYYESHRPYSLQVVRA